MTGLVVVGSGPAGVAAAEAFRRNEPHLPIRILTEDAATRIVVDEHQRTSVANVFAAGDVALTHNRSARRAVPVEHWQDAIEQGKMAGDNASGGKAGWDTVPGFWTTIGDATLKYHAWGDGFDSSRLIDHADGFTVWYESDGRLVGVLTHDADDDHERAEALIRQGDPVPVPQPAAPALHPRQSFASDG